MKSFIFPNGTLITLKSIISAQVGEKVQAGALHKDSGEIKDRVIVHYGCGGGPRRGGQMNAIIINCDSPQEAKNLLRKLNLAIIRNVH